ncbi:Glycosyl transferase family 2 [Paracoccus tibetensis]|uniref:Glycosyl transferase family 2 n=1 Tax=Paracoccus tibetensis TaxID=336292 RepID=A0A1G5IPH0_9RHOB|nr:Glycosyl transferase family 2 [Paracoccus tibetensis]
MILLASYQGAAHIGAQLDSIAVQTHRDWSLIVSDDGSTDGTRDIVRDFAARFPSGRVALVDGPRKGATPNFLSLLARAPEGAALAFSDQDDLWLPGKLSRALDVVSGAQPAHYAARTIITDENLCPLTGSRLFHRPFGLRNALVQALMAGNTSVFNPAAARLLKEGAAAAEAAQIPAHDWWAYQLMAAAGARLVHDPQPALLYRQHPRSEVGRNDTLGALALRARRLAQGEFGDWMASNLDALAGAEHLLTKEGRDLLHAVRPLIDMSGAEAVRLILKTGLYRQTRAGTAALLSAAAAGRLRARRLPQASRPPEGGR